MENTTVNGKFSTSDIGLAAFCLMRGMSISTAKRLGKRFVFEFKDAPAVGEQLKAEWVNSESYRYDNAMRGLKSLLYSSNREEGGA